jgi:predicted short-subunit dehydrogenase-like oxidoreductase (DUF2520 family)
MPKQSKTNKSHPSVSIIGPGKVGQALAHALHSLGYPLVALVFRNREKVQQFSENGRSFFPKTVLLALDDLGELPESDLIFITTPDDAIEETAKRLAALQRPTLNTKKGKGSNYPGAVLHTSGALSSEVLAPLRSRSCQVGSIHPLVSVNFPDPAAATFEGAYFCVEGEKMAVIYAQEIIRELGANSVHIKTDRKALYHAAAVMASPHLTALFDLAVELLIESGVKHDDAQKIFLPLVESTVKNLRHSDPAGALTGTFARGDVETVKLHLKALTAGNQKPPTEALEVYKLLGLRSLQLAKKGGLDPKKISAIVKLLKGKPPKHSER